MKDATQHSTAGASVGGQVRGTYRMNARAVDCFGRVHLSSKHPLRTQQHIQDVVAWLLSNLYVTLHLPLSFTPAKHPQTNNNEYSRRSREVVRGGLGGQRTNHNAHTHTKQYTRLLYHGVSAGNKTAAGAQRRGQARTKTTRQPCTAAFSISSRRNSAWPIAMSFLDTVLPNGDPSTISDTRKCGRKSTLKQQRSSPSVVFRSDVAKVLGPQSLHASQHITPQPCFAQSSSCLRPSRLPPLPLRLPPPTSRTSPWTSPTLVVTSRTLKVSFLSATAGWELPATALDPHPSSPYLCCRQLLPEPQHVPR
jgi:hypothetical protein